MKFTKKLKETWSKIIGVVLKILLIIGIISFVTLMVTANLGVSDHPLMLIPRVIVAFELAVVILFLVIWGIITFVNRVIDFIGFARCDYCKKIYHTSQQKVSATRQGDEERPKFGSDYSVNVRFEVRRPCCGKTVCEVCRVVGDCRGVSDSDIMFAARSKFGVSHFSVSVSRF